MKFLQAHQTLAQLDTNAEPLPFLLGLSGTPGPLPFFLRAAAAARSVRAEPHLPEFNTLQQLLLSPPAAPFEIFMLLPWDLAAQADWRSGIPSGPVEYDRLLHDARTVIERLEQRPAASYYYLPAPLPPLFRDPPTNVRIESDLLQLVASLQANLLPSAAFSLQNYLSTGHPLASDCIGEVATTMVDGLLAPRVPCKVLVTDLDNVMWHGTIAEDGVDAIQFEPQGLGYRFFIYQTLLAKLQAEGVLLAAASRNDPDVAQLPFATGRMVLRKANFVTIRAGYGAKSTQIRDIAQRLNLGLNSVVFVDDNPIELAEVAKSLPDVHCVPFPDNDAGLPGFLHQLNRLFRRSTNVTDEDRRRTELYRIGMEVPVSQTDGADIIDYLQTLQMRLVIADRTKGDRCRALQLINKTNQFNLNGERLDEPALEDLIAKGGRLYTATLSDRHGSHGEILACLVSAEGTIVAFVMSCRVLQRRVEHAFISWLAAQSEHPLRLSFKRTPRNSPLCTFVSDPAFIPQAGALILDRARFLADHERERTLFALDVDVTTD